MQVTTHPHSVSAKQAVNSSQQFVFVHAAHSSSPVMGWQTIESLADSGSRLSVAPAMESVSDAVGVIAKLGSVSAVSIAREDALAPFDASSVDVDDGTWNSPQAKAPTSRTLVVRVCAVSMDFTAVQPPLESCRTLLSANHEPMSFLHAFGGIGEVQPFAWVRTGDGFCTLLLEVERDHERTRPGLAGARRVCSVRLHPNWTERLVNAPSIHHPVMGKVVGGFASATAPSATSMGA